MARSPLTYHFDWDPVKAQTNVREHEIAFRLATTVFHDPLALTVYDEPHSESEERWATIYNAGNTGVVPFSVANSIRTWPVSFATPSLKTRR